MYIYFICLNLKNQRLLKTCHILQGQYESQFYSKTTKTRLANLKHMNGVRQVSSSVHNDLLSRLGLLVSFLSFLPEKFQLVKEHVQQGGVIQQLFAIFEKLHISAGQVYLQEVNSKKSTNFTAHALIACVAKFTFSKK